MRSPVRALPDAVVRWTRRAAWLRRFDALLAWLACVWGFPDAPAALPALVAAALVATATAIPAVRSVWRPLSGTVGLAVSRPLNPGRQAWFVRRGKADLVLVTARRGFRVTIALGAQSRDEVMSVRRTRIFLIPDDSV